MLRLAVAAHPGARTDRVELGEGSQLSVWVRARPVDGQANAAIERTIASHLGIRAREVRLVSGVTSRRKIVEIDLPNEDVIRERLVAYGVRAD